MENITPTFRLAVDALLLRDSAYQSMRDDAHPFTRGLTLIVGVGLLIAIFSLVGTALLRLTSPDTGAIQQAVWEGMQEMPWVQQIPADRRAEVMAEIKRNFDLGWRIVRLFAPSITRSLINIVLNPMVLIVGWLLYGFLAFLSARTLGGRGRLDQTYGTTALAVAPRMLGVAHVLPYVDTAGLGIWALICNYLAIKHTHHLSPWRAFWATTIPLILLALFVIGLAILGITVAVIAFGGGTA